MHVPTLVAALAIVVVATAIFVYIAQRIGLVAIVGYIVAGILIGPHALGLFIDDFELVEAMGEIGVIFLMFFIGLELGAFKMGCKGGSHLHLQRRCKCVPALGTHYNRN